MTDLTFMGQRVLDGDCHDFRSLDPGRSIIGLTYKVPLVPRYVLDENERQPFTMNELLKKVKLGKDVERLTSMKKGDAIIVGGHHIRRIARKLTIPDESKFIIRTTYDTSSGALIVAGTPSQLGASVFEDVAPTEVVA